MALGDLTAIGDVTEMLKALLEEPPAPGEEALTVTLDSPASLESGGSGEEWAKVNLYLYQVSEDPHSKNTPWETRVDGVKVYPPLALDLHYLLTPYSNDPISAHQVLTYAMQVLYVNAVLGGADLPAPVRLTGVERLTVNLIQMSLEDLTRIWNSLQTPYRLSIAYQVRIVLVDSEVQEASSRVETAIHAFTEK